MSLKSQSDCLNNRLESCIEVCQGPDCREYGGPELLSELNKQGFPTKPGHCQGLCHFAPIVHINKTCIAEAKLKGVIQSFEQ